MQERLHTFKGIGKQDVFFLHLPQNAFIFVDAGRILWFKNRVGQRFPLGVGELIRQGEYISHGHRGGCGINHGRRQCQMFTKIGDEMFADRMGDLHTHRRQPPPLSQHFLHFFPKVAAYVKGFIVGVDIRVSGDADTNLFIDGVVIENLVHKFQYDVFHTDVTHVDSRQEQNFRQCLRHRNDGKDLFAFEFQHRAYMDDFILQMWKRMVGIHNLRR